MMKSMLRMMVIVFAGALVSCAWAEEKIAFIESSRVLKEYYKTKQADAQMEKQADEFKGEQDRMMEERKKLVATYEAARDEAQDKTLNEVARDRKRDAAEDKLAELKDYDGKIRDTAVQRRKQIEEQRRLMYKGLLDELQKAVKEYATREGYTIVFDSLDLTGGGMGTVVYGDARLNITDKMIELMNKNQPADKPKDAAPAKPTKPTE